MIASLLLTAHYDSPSRSPDPPIKVFEEVTAMTMMLVAFRLGICQDRRDRRSCKIFPNCVKFWGNNANSLGNYRVTYALNE